MIPQGHFRKLLGFSIGTLVVVLLSTSVYLHHLNQTTEAEVKAQQAAEGNSPEGTSLSEQVSLQSIQERMMALFHQDAYYFDIRDAKLYLDAYYDYPLLFSIDARYQSDLNRLHIPEPLRTAFRRQGIRLTPNAKVTIGQMGQRWTISDRKGYIPWTLKFTIQREGNQLNVYRNPSDFVDWQLQVDFASLYPERYKEGETDWNIMPWEELKRMYNEYVKTRDPKWTRIRYRLINQSVAQAR